MDVDQTKAAESLQQELVIVNGIRVSPFFSPRWVEKEMKNMALRPDDIWIVSHPKSGTTWTQQIVKLILNNGRETDKMLFESVPWVECFNKDSNFPLAMPLDIDSYPSPRAFKSHFPYDAMPCGLPSATPGLYIYVARNPKDVMVSYYYNYRRLSFLPTYEWNKFFDMFVKGELLFGDYFNHVLSWWKHRDDPNVLFIKYEDMKRDLLTTVAKIASFIDFELDKDTLASIADNASFERMKDNSVVNIGLPSDTLIPTETKLFRKGVVGDWKNIFTPEQSSQIDTLYKDKFLSVGLEFYFGF